MLGRCSLQSSALRVLERLDFLRGVESIWTSVAESLTVNVETAYTPQPLGQVGGSC